MPDAHVTGIQWRKGIAPIAEHLAKHPQRQMRQRLPTSNEKSCRARQQPPRKRGARLVSPLNVKWLAVHVAGAIAGRALGQVVIGACRLIRHTKSLALLPRRRGVSRWCGIGESLPKGRTHEALPSI